MFGKIGQNILRSKKKKKKKKKKKLWFTDCNLTWKKKNERKKKKLTTYLPYDKLVMKLETEHLFFLGLSYSATVSIHNLQDIKWTLYQLSYCVDPQPPRHKVVTISTELPGQSTTSKTQSEHYNKWATVSIHNLPDTKWTPYQMSYFVNPQPPRHKVDIIPTELLCRSTTSKTQRGHYTNWATVSIHNFQDTKRTLYQLSYCVNS